MCGYTCSAIVFVSAIEPRVSCKYGTAKKESSNMAYVIIGASIPFFTVDAVTRKVRVFLSSRIDDRLSSRVCSVVERLYNATSGATNIFWISCFEEERPVDAVLKRNDQLIQF